MKHPPTHEEDLKESSSRPNNQILAALPRDEYKRLAPNLERVHLPKNRILCEAGDDLRYGYFLDTGVVSLLAITEAGQTIDISMVGNEGFVSVSIIFLSPFTSCRIVVQMPSDALRIATKYLLSEFHRGDVFQQLLLRYANVLQLQTMQSAVCHSLHGVSQRVSRFLLTISDYLGSDTFDLTQEEFALMLGHERSRVGLRAGELQKRGIIKYGRGRVTILDRRELAAAACECYRVIKDQTRSYLSY